MPHLPFSELPVANPGTPPLTSPRRYLSWLAMQQSGLLGFNAIFGVGWMVAQALVWAAVGEAIDRGVLAHDPRALWAWVGVVLALGVVQAICGALRHQLAVTNWMHASFRTVQLIGRHSAHSGPAITESIAAGDVVNTVGSDAMRVGGTFDGLARFIGSIVAWLVVSLILLATSVQLGLIVLIGVPVLAALTGPLMRPLHRSQAAQRDASGHLSTMAADTVAGLRILRGVGGEDVFLQNYRVQNEAVRVAGVRIATPQAGLESGQVLLPAILTTVVTWIGAHDVVSGTLQAGQLVAFFGYSTFLTTPLRTVIEWLISATRAHVGASRTLRILQISPNVVDDGTRTPWPEHWEKLKDTDSGLELRQGEMIGLVTADSAEVVALLERISHFRSDISGVFLDDVALNNIELASTRAHIVVSEIEPRLFSGALLEELTTNRATSQERVMDALEAASAVDILDQLDGGLLAVVEERGRTFSGGQRQRLVLARALLTQAEILILVEPTSAMDTHSESRIAQRLRGYRRGLTTVVVTTSPLLLEQMDRVLIAVDERVIDNGTHVNLLHRSEAYRRIVLRSDLS